MKNTTFIKTALTYLFLIVAYLAVFFRFSEAKAAFLRSLRFCLQGLLPPLFPMLALSGTAAGLSPSKRPRRRRAVFSILTGASDGFADAYLFGMLGGYPVGVKTLAKKRIAPGREAEEAKLLAMCAVNPGPAYAVLTVGVTVFGAKRTGVILYFSVLLADALLFRLLKKRKRLSAFPDAKEQDRPYAGLLTVFPAAVEAAVGSCLHIIAWVVLFSIIIAVFSPVTGLPACRLLLEITAAVDCSHELKSLPLCAFSLGFGGLCLSMQLFTDLRALSVRLREYLLCRFAAGTLSAGFAWLLFRLFPASVEAVAARNEVRIFSSSPAGTVFLLLTCILFILECDLKDPVKKKRISHTCRA